MPTMGEEQRRRMVHIPREIAGEYFPQGKDPYCTADLRHSSIDDIGAVIARIAAAGRLADPRERLEELKMARVALERLISRESK